MGKLTNQYVLPRRSLCFLEAPFENFCLDDTGALVIAESSYMRMTVDVHSWIMQAEKAAGRSAQDISFESREKTDSVSLPMGDGALLCHHIWAMQALEHEYGPMPEDVANAYFVMWMYFSDARLPYKHIIVTPPKNVRGERIFKFLPYTEPGLAIRKEQFKRRLADSQIAAAVDLTLPVYYDYLFETATMPLAILERFRRAFDFVEVPKEWFKYIDRNQPLALDEKSNRADNALGLWLLKSRIDKELTRPEVCEKLGLEGFTPKKLEAKELGTGLVLEEEFQALQTLFGQAPQKAADRWRRAYQTFQKRRQTAEARAALAQKRAKEKQEAEARRLALQEAKKLEKLRAEELARNKAQEKARLKAENEARKKAEKLARRQARQERQNVLPPFKSSVLEIQPKSEPINQKEQTMPVPQTQKNNAAVAENEPKYQTLVNPDNDNIALGTILERNFGLGRCIVPFVNWFKAIVMDKNEGKGIDYMAQRFGAKEKNEFSKALTAKSVPGIETVARIEAEFGRMPFVVEQAYFGGWHLRSGSVLKERLDTLNRENPSRKLALTEIGKQLRLAQFHARLSDETLCRQTGIDAGFYFDLLFFPVPVSSNVLGLIGRVCGLSDIPEAWREFITSDKAPVYAESYKHSLGLETDKKLSAFALWLIESRESREQGRLWTAAQTGTRIELVESYESGIAIPDPAFVRNFERTCASMPEDIERNYVCSLAERDYRNKYATFGALAMFKDTVHQRKTVAEVFEACGLEPKAFLNHLSDPRSLQMQDLELVAVVLNLEKVPSSWLDNKQGVRIGQDGIKAYPAFLQPVQKDEFPEVPASATESEVEEETLNAFACWVRKEREKRGLTRLTFMAQNKLSAVYEQRLRRWETGLAICDMHDLDMLIRALGPMPQDAFEAWKELSLKRVRMSEADRKHIEKLQYSPEGAYSPQAVRAAKRLQKKAATQTRTETVVDKDLGDQSTSASLAASKSPSAAIAESAELVKILERERAEKVDLQKTIRAMQEKIDELQKTKAADETAQSRVSDSNGFLIRPLVEPSVYEKQLTGIKELVSPLSQDEIARLRSFWTTDVTLGKLNVLGAVAQVDTSVTGVKRDGLYLLKIAESMAMRWLSIKDDGTIESVKDDGSVTVFASPDKLPNVIGRIDVLSATIQPKRPEAA